MRQDQYELKGAVLEAPLEWQGLRLAPGRGGVLVTGLEGTDQRRFQRQLTVLKGYAALAADIAEGATEDKMKEIAQEELGLISPNQRVFSVGN